MNGSAPAASGGRDSGPVTTIIPTPHEEGGSDRSRPPLPTPLRGLARPPREAATLRAVPRPSPVTDRVRALLLAGERHAWSLDELHEGVREEIPGAVFSSIFRAVTDLERRGVVRRVDLGDGRPRYEGTGSHHEHIRCTSCGSVAEVPGCVIGEVTASVQRQTNYVVTGHEVVFSGLCPNCVPGTSSSP